LAVNPTDMADEIRIGMGFPPPTSDINIGWATGVLAELTENGTASFGGSPGPHPVSGLTGPSMALKIQTEAGYPFISPELTLYATALSNYIIAFAVVTYTGPPPSAGNPDWYLGGTIGGMTGAAMAAAVALGVGFPFVSTELLNKCTAIVDHIQSNAEVEGDGVLPPEIS